MSGGGGSGPPDFPSLDDRALVAEAARGEVKAFAALYDRFAGVMLATSKRMLGDRGGAEDLVHDVFMEVWRNCDNYDPARATVRTWILVRLRSRALDRLRSATVRREVTTDDVAPNESAPASEDPSLAPDRAAVVEALAQLPDEQRMVIELSYFHGLSSSEIAARMGSPLGTVKSRTAAGLAKIRSAMQIGVGR
ncbi:MAG: sigma-70 family RNA polymerase sigma factor [Nannocystaceae bacterium]|nr:sigma-70 family RNA polymerase sigma factor [bacterium]